MVRGLDHLVVAVRDLDAAAAAWEALGFTVTPEARHSWGTANRLVQLDGFFIELLCVADETLITEAGPDGFSFGAFNRDFLKNRQGGSMLVLESLDPEADRAAYLGHGLKLYEPFWFERTATFADGTTGKVAFDLTFVSDRLAPGIGFFTCRNRYPETFWRPSFQIHDNGAESIESVTLVAADPSDHHEFLGGFSGQREMRATSLGLEVATPRGRILVLTPGAYSQLFGSAAANDLPGDLPAIAALTITCNGLTERRIIPAHELFGVTLVLEPKN